MPGPDAGRRRADESGRRHEALIGILGVDAALDRVTERRQRTDRIDVEPLAAGNPDLPVDEVEAGHHLGHRMLDLQPGVHLEEIERAVVVEQELDRARVGVAHRARDRGRRGGDALPQCAG